jgi:hypothetical protein
MSDNPVAGPEVDLDDTEVIEEAYLTYRGAGLRLPPVPHQLVDALEQYGEWRFGSDDIDPADRTGFIAIAANRSAPSEVAFGHVGHGYATWHLCCRLVHGPIAVFVRQLYGGASLGTEEEDDEPARAVFNHTMMSLEELVALALSAEDRGLLPEESRLVLVLDDREGNFWQMLPNGERHDSERTLADAHMGLLRAFNAPGRRSQSDPAPSQMG